MDTFCFLALNSANSIICKARQGAVNPVPWAQPWHQSMLAGRSSRRRLWRSCSFCPCIQPYTCTDSLVEVPHLLMHALEKLQLQPELSPVRRLRRRNGKCLARDSMHTILRDVCSYLWAYSNCDLKKSKHSLSTKVSSPEECENARSC